MMRCGIRPSGNLRCRSLVEVKLPYGARTRALLRGRDRGSPQHAHCCIQTESPREVGIRLKDKPRHLDGTLAHRDLNMSRGIALLEPRAEPPVLETCLRADMEIKVLSRVQAG